MRAQFTTYCLLGLLLASACLSETLIDNYDATKVASHVGGSSVSPYGFGGDMASPVGAYLPPPVFVNATSHVDAAGRRGVLDATGGMSGEQPGAAGVAGGGAGGAGTRGGSTIGENVGGVAGRPSARIIRAAPNGNYSLVRYLAYDASAIGQPGIALGVTEADHLIAVLSTPGTEAENLGLYGGQGESALGLLEVTPNGIPLRSAVHLSDHLPDAFSVDSSGNVLLAGSLEQDVNLGGPTISKLYHGFYVAALDADWEQTFGRGYVTQSDVHVTSIQSDGNAGMLATLLEGTSSATFAPYVIDFDSNGDERYRWGLDAGSSGSIASLAFDATGSVYAVGAFDGAFAVGEQALASRGQSDGWLAVLNRASGGIPSAARFGGSFADAASIVEAVPNGHWRIGGQLSRETELFGVNLDVATNTAPFVCDLDASGHVTWIVLLGGAGTVTAAWQQGDRTYVAGHLYGPSTSDPMRDSQLYVAVLELEGAVSSMFTLASSGDSATHIVVDSKSTIWLSGRADLAASGSETVTDSIGLMQFDPTSAKPGN